MIHQEAEETHTHTHTHTERERQTELGHHMSICCRAQGKSRLPEGSDRVHSKAINVIYILLSSDLKKKKKTF